MICPEFNDQISWLLIGVAISIASYVAWNLFLDIMYIIFGNDDDSKESEIKK